MSAPTVVERVCDVLETIALNGPVTMADLRAQTGLSRFQVAHYLRELEEAGFVEIAPAETAVVGDRLRLIVEYLRASR